MMRGVMWDLELRFEDEAHYFRFMEKFMAYDKTVRDAPIPTEFSVSPSIDVITVVISCGYAQRLSEIASLIASMENEQEQPL